MHMNIWPILPFLCIEQWWADSSPVLVFMVISPQIWRVISPTNLNHAFLGRAYIFSCSLVIVFEMLKSAVLVLPRQNQSSLLKSSTLLWSGKLDNSVLIHAKNPWEKVCWLMFSWSHMFLQSSRFWRCNDFAPSEGASISPDAFSQVIISACSQKCTFLTTTPCCLQ